MLVIYGLREEYNGLKSTLLAHQAPTSFQELHGLLADHDFMVKKNPPTVAPAQAFTTIAAGPSTLLVPQHILIPYKLYNNLLLSWVFNLTRLPHYLLKPFILTGLLPLGVVGPTTVVAEETRTNKQSVIEANSPGNPIKT